MEEESRVSKEESRGSKERSRGSNEVSRGSSECTECETSDQETVNEESVQVQGSQTQRQSHTAVGKTTSSMIYRLNNSMIIASSRSSLFPGLFMILHNMH